MKIFADLHIHSRFARATSGQINIPNLEKYARIKGVTLLGTGDFTHPKWLQELKQELSEDGSGILKTKSEFPFVLQGEISLMYTDMKKGRKVHFVTLAPSFEILGQITDYLKKKGRIDYDGRPIFGIKSEEFIESLKKISDDIEIIPAHAWTPWFGILGSKSGFDSFEEAFKDQAKHVFSLETGLSSDPEMNWRVSKLDKTTILSFSDAHSLWPWRLGREATIFDLKELTYKNLIKAIREKEGYAGTIEVDPGYGKYHFDGHRTCNISFSPEDSKKYNNICPVCGRPLTIGVLARVEELADRPLGFKPKDAVPYYTLLPLSELAAAFLKTTPSGKKVAEIHEKLIAEFGTEFNVLISAKEEELKKVVPEKLAELIIKNRNKELTVKPGYDGVYGEVLIDGPEQKTEVAKFQKPQKTLADF